MRYTVHKSIRLKLFIAFLLTTLLVVAGMQFFMRWSLERGFSEFIETRQHGRIELLIENLADNYAKYGNWHALANNKRQWIQLLQSYNPRRRHPMRWVNKALQEPLKTWPPSFSSRQTNRPFTALKLRVMLLNSDKSIIFGRAEDLSLLTLNPIKHEGQTVGYLGLLPGKPTKQLSDLKFMEQQDKAFILIALLMIVLSAGVALFLAYLFGRPLKRITAATNKLGMGQYSIRLPVKSNDELGQLAQHFNEMAAALEQSEQSRQRWIADISHELRTPLAVLQGELEALQDGIRPMNREAIDSLFSDVMRLNRLTEDLYQLTLSDQGALTYRKTKIQPVAVLKQNLTGLKHEFEKKEITIKLVENEGPVSLFADSERLAQLFRNILNNSLNYTNSGGQIDIMVSNNKTQLIIDINDSAPSVPKQELNKLFDRLYRVESSRNRNLGGTGLGLAICSNIVSAHNGIITAQASSLGGLTIHIELPLQS